MGSEGAPEPDATEHDPANVAGGLRTRVMAGAGYLIARQGIGMAVSLGGLLTLTRTIGPAAYGTYAAYLGLFAFATQVVRFGVDVYLLRAAEVDRRDDLDQAFAFLLLVGVAMATLGWVCVLWFQDWLGLEGAIRVGAWFVVLLPLNLVSLVPKACLERRLAYRAIAWVELAGHLTLYGVAVPLALVGWGVMAPVAGWVAQQAIIGGLTFSLARYVPRWFWNARLLRTMLTYGVGYASSRWIWQARELVNPLVVGGLAGVEAVGHVALAIRLVNSISFVRDATYRLSISSFARIQHDVEKLRMIVREGMRLQVLAVGPLLLAFMAMGPWLLPRIFGAEWTPLLTVFPFIALGTLSNAAFNLHSSALYVLRRNVAVAAFHVVHVATFASAAYVLVDRFGFSGYGWAEIPALASYALLHVIARRRIGSPTDTVALGWAAAFGVALFYPLLGVSALAGLVLVALWPASLRALRGHAMDVRRFVHG